MALRNGRVVLGNGLHHSNVRVMLMYKRQYNRQHKNERAAAIALMPEGAPCPLCHKAMYKRQALDYDHTIPVALGGINSAKRLTHAKCNRSAGGKLAHKLKRIHRINSRERTLPRW